MILTKKKTLIFCTIIGLLIGSVIGLSVQYFLDLDTPFISVGIINGFTVMGLALGISKTKDEKPQ